MTYVNFLFHRLFISETQTDRQAERHPDRQDKFVIDTNGWFYRYGHKYLAYPQDSLICWAICKGFLASAHLFDSLVSRNSYLNTKSGH